MSDSIKLNFINLSNDANNSDVVIFQKNVPLSSNGMPVAWTVIRDCGRGDNHPFIYPFQNYVSAMDSFGNYTPRLKAEPGDAFQVTRTDSGDQLSQAGIANTPTEIQLKNNLVKGSINAWIYKSGRALAVKTGVAPGQMAAFSFRPEIYIGVASQVEEGSVMDAAVVATIDTQISLLGISSADIVMTGGGSGEDAEPFEFTLQNVVMA